MILSKKILKEIPAADLTGIPAEQNFELPEKVLQFGTGVLLRGLPDYFIDKANKQGVFNGRIVVVKSTAQGSTELFNRQDNLYTVCVRGVQKAKTTNEMMINGSISRVLSAAHQWKEILACAANPEMQIIISNTTEAGLVPVEDDPHLSPPASFPGKLLAFLQERYRYFKGSIESGMLIIPTELIPDNGNLLKQILIRISRNLKLDEHFIRWLETANAFCSSLVDCIVPGSLPDEERETVFTRLGYEDDLLIMSEVYRLWAIESSSGQVEKILSFSKTDKRIIITADISKFRDLKLRLLNGSHTFTCGLAVWAGFPFVKTAMENEGFADFITRLLMDEIVPAIRSEKITTDEAARFANDVLDRFRNPFIQHRWLSICLQYTSKMKTRNVPAIQQYYEKKGSTPRFMAAGFAAWLLFMRSEKKSENRFAGSLHGTEYILQDDFAEKLNTYWNQAGTDTELLVSSTLRDETLWGADLTGYPGFAETVLDRLQQLMETDPASFFREMNK